MSAPLVARFVLITLLAFMLIACNNQPARNTVVHTDTPAHATAPQAAEATKPDVRSFAYTEEVLAVVEGAGCGYTALNVQGDSTLFASAEDAVISVGGKIEVLKHVSHHTYNLDSDWNQYENVHYRVDIRTVTDSVLEGGVSQHGDMTVEDKRSGAKTTVALVGGCGC